MATMDVMRHALMCRTRYSYGRGLSSVESMLERAAELGVDLVGICDEMSLAAHLEAHEHARRLGISVALGVEWVDYKEEERDLVQAALLGEAVPESRCVVWALNRAGWWELAALVEGRLHPTQVRDCLVCIGHMGSRTYAAAVKGEGRRAVTLARSILPQAKPGRSLVICPAERWPDARRAAPRLASLADLLKIGHAHAAQAWWATEDLRDAAQVYAALKDRVVIDIELLRLGVLPSGGHLIPQVSSVGSAMGLWDLKDAADAMVGTMPWSDGATYIPKVADDEPLELRRWCERGMARLGLGEREEYRARLEHELGVFERMGFAGYMLIVEDFVSWARRQGFPVGPGRGSAAGSLVAYTLGITAVDPIKYGLLFERFLNEQRVSWPDIDADFGPKAREPIFEYMRQTYGADHFGQIMTNSSLAADGAINAACQVTDMRLGEISVFKREIRDELRDMTLAKLVEQGFLESFSDDPDMQFRLRVASQLEGCITHSGVHAAGALITSKPVREILPIVDGVASVDKDRVELFGAIKFDVLGVLELDVLARTERFIGEAIPYEPRDDEDERDAAAWSLIGDANTLYVFQLASTGMRRQLRRLRPTSIEMLTAISALFRPGPLGAGMVDVYVDRARGKESVVYPHELIEPALRHTYGVIVYQEQVMEIARTMGGMSMAESDLLRRAISKKKDMEGYKATFVDGAKAQGVPEETALYVWGQMEKFAAYGFNKSHACAYSFISFATAWAKANHFLEYMCAAIDERSDLRAQGLFEVKAAGYRVLGPDIASEHMRTTPDPLLTRPVSGEAIMLGLGTLAGANSAKLAALCELIRSGDILGPGAGLELYEIISATNMDHATWSALTFAGGLDAWCATGDLYEQRAALIANFARLAKSSRRVKGDQASLFAPSEQGIRVLSHAELIDEGVEVKTPEEIAWGQFKALGFFVDADPMQRRRSEHTLEGMRALYEERGEGEYTFVGVLTDVVKTHDKGGRPYLQVHLQDESAMTRAVAFGKDQEIEELAEFKSAKLVRLSLMVSKRQGYIDYRVIATRRRG